MPEDLDEIKIEDLIDVKNLELLDEKSMGEALKQYIDNNEDGAIATMVEKMLKQKTLMKQAMAGGENGDSGTAMDNPTAVREVRADYDVERDEAA